MYRIFIVEDDRGIAQAIQEQIQMWAMEARCAENFREVMAEFAAYSPQLVLLDIGLPKGIQGSHHFSLFRLRQYEYCDGYEHGS